MLSYLVKRLLSLVPVLLVVSVVIFLLIHLIPGDPAAIILGEEATPEQVAALRREMGLERPIWEQYISWLGSVLTGDLGRSVFLDQPVTSAIGERLGPTASLAVLAMAVTLVVAVPLGIAAARRAGTFWDQGIMGVTLVGMALPSFLLALLLVLVFSIWLGWLPAVGYRPLGEGPGEFLRHLILPAIALGTVLAALIARMTRASVLEVLQQDYVRLARSGGVPEHTIVYRNAFRNALLPIITVVGATFGSLITGAVVTETVFNIPGVGQLMVSSIARRDYPVIQGVILFATVVYVLVNLVIDVLYGLIDPRVRLGEDQEAS